MMEELYREEGIPKFDPAATILKLPQTREEMSRFVPGIGWDLKNGGTTESFTIPRADEQPQCQRVFWIRYERKRWGVSRTAHISQPRESWCGTTNRGSVSTRTCDREELNMDWEEYLKECREGEVQRIINRMRGEKAAPTKIERRETEVFSDLIGEDGYNWIEDPEGRIPLMESEGRSLEQEQESATPESYRGEMKVLRHHYG